MIARKVYLEKINSADYHLGDWVNNTRFKRIQADGYCIITPRGTPSHSVRMSDLHL